MRVDERKLSETIFRNGHIIAPLGLIILSFLIAGSDAWILASGSAILLTAYIMGGWDGRILLIYGVMMLVLSGIFVFTFPDHADWAAVQGYWLLAAGTAAMVIASPQKGIRARAWRRGSRAGRRYTPNL